MHTVQRYVTFSAISTTNTTNSQRGPSRVCVPIFSLKRPHLRGDCRSIFRLAHCPLSTIHHRTRHRTRHTTFVTFGIPDDITMDGGPEFTAITAKKFFSGWGVPSLIPIEIRGVKTVKRALAGNTPANGNLDCDSFQRAMVAYKYTRSNH